MRKSLDDVNFFRTFIRRYIKLLVSDKKLS